MPRCAGTSRQRHTLGAFPLLRGTTADLGGNITMEREALTLDNLALAMAAKNSNGFVIAQVERVCAHGALNPRQVQIPDVEAHSLDIAFSGVTPPVGPHSCSSSS